MRKRCRLKLAAELLAMLCASACVQTMFFGLGATAALGTYKWIWGSMEKAYPRPMQDVWNAALAACKDMKMNIGSQEYSPVESRIEAVQPPDTNVNINLIGGPNQNTTVKVRFGLMGNVHASAYFHCLIMEHLGLRPG